ncbi:MAG: hypothetical protein Q4E55_05350 [Bacteroidales bacterium]|nr:hypothetical protein [Bacteroidales bacterium]
MKNKRSDRSKTILWFTLIVTALLIAISFIPPITIGGVKLNRVNIISFVDFHDPTISPLTSADILDITSIENLSPHPALPPIDSVVTGSLLVGEENKAETCCKDTIEVRQPDEKAVPSEPMPPTAVSEPTVYALDYTGIEDYSRKGEMIRHFVKSLVNDSKTRNIRIAFLGDSFIEGDIISSDFRRQLQGEFGGEGIGFIPFADPVGKYRPYICQESTNWTCYNLLRMKKVPAKYQKEFYVSGYVCVPKSGASATFYPRPNGLSQLSSAQIIFKNRGATEMEVIVNKSDTMNIVLQQKDEVQQIHIDKQDIRHLTIKLPKSNDFIGYGVVFSGNRGVNVDNYALRSNSGLNILATDYTVNQQINKLLQYDMVVLEYGLNALQKTVVNYDFYGTKLEKVIDYIKVCFPGSAILFVSVGDVGMKKENTIITAPAVKPMVEAQRKAAQNQEVAFWNLFSSMGGDNSIQRYVKNGWAAKDYLHINHKGGHEISNLLIQALYEQLKLYDQQPNFQ